MNNIFFFFNLHIKVDQKRYAVHLGKTVNYFGSRFGLYHLCN